MLQLKLEYYLNIPINQKPTQGGVMPTPEEREQSNNVSLSPEHKERLDAQFKTAQDNLRKRLDELSEKSKTHSVVVKIWQMEEKADPSAEKEALLNLTNILDALKAMFPDENFGASYYGKSDKEIMCSELVDGLENLSDQEIISLHAQAIAQSVLFPDSKQNWGIREKSLYEELINRMGRPYPEDPAEIAFCAVMSLDMPQNLPNNRINVNTNDLKKVLIEAFNK
jgi:hypothetical protein